MILKNAGSTIRYEIFASKTRNLKKDAAEPRGEKKSMLMHAFLPILSILGIGIGLVYLASVLFHFRLDLGDRYLISVLVGFGSVIFPMILVGILFAGKLQFVPRLHIFCSTIVVLLGLYHYLTHNIHRLEHIQLKFPKASWAEYLLGILIVIFLLEYLFLLLLFPMQGFDALETYLPNALIFYQTDSIPSVNILTAMPIFREPGHALLFTYILYVSGRDTYQLIPFLTIVSLTILAYRFGVVFLESRRNGLLSAVLLLALPLTRELFTIWAYYQDIYIAFFYSAGIYFFLLAFRRKQNTYSIIAGLATGLAILTKMSGWTLLFIFLLLAPSGNKGKALKISILLPVAALLAMKAIGTIYVGIAIPIAIIVFILTFMILKMPTQQGSLKKTIIPLSVGIATGGWWLWRVRRVLPQSFEAFIQLYFVVKGSPQWTYPVDASPEVLPIKEHMHSLSFLGTCLILFVSAWFAAGWLVPKLIGFFSGISETPLIIWCLGFLAIWFAYYFLISVRYLSVIILPLVLLTAKGTELLYQRVLVGKMPRLTLEAFLLAAATFQIRHSVFQKQIWEPPARSFVYATNPLAVLLIALGLFSISIGILITVGYIDDFLCLDRAVRFIRTKQLLAGGLLVLLLFLTITAPVEKEIHSMRAVSWDTDHFQERYIFEYRPTFQELVQAIIAENSPGKSIIGANVAGLEFFVQQPVVDLIWWGRPIVTPLFTEENVTRGLERLDKLNTGFIVGLKEGNYLHEDFLSQIVSQTYLYSIVDYNSYFKRILNNNEFVLYRLISVNPFAGIVNLKLRTSNETTSILGDCHKDFSSTTRPTLIATTDLTMLQWTQMEVTSHVDYIAYGKNETQTRQFILGKQTGFVDFQIFDFPENRFMMTGLNLTCTLYDSGTNTTKEFVFSAETNGQPLMVLHKYHWTSYSRTSEWTIQTYGRFMLSKQFNA